MVLERDERAITFLTHFKMATSKQINELVYKNINICNRRLKKMCDNKILYREKNVYGLGYLYSTKPIKSLTQLKHTLLRIDVYLKLLEMGVKIDVTMVEPAYGSIRPDAVMSVNYNGEWRVILLEVETSNQTIDIKKYNNWMIVEYKKYLTIKPLVVYITDKYIDPEGCQFNYVRISSNLSNLIDIFN